MSCRLEGARTTSDVVHEVARVLGLATSADADAAALAERVGVRSHCEGACSSPSTTPTDAGLRW